MTDEVIYMGTRYLCRSLMSSEACDYETRRSNWPTDFRLFIIINSTLTLVGGTVRTAALI